MDAKRRKTESGSTGFRHRREFRVADGFKGKEFHAGGTWEVPKGWRLVIQTEAVLFFAAMMAVIIGDIANLGKRFMVSAVAAAVTLACVAAVTMVVCIMKMNKQEPMDVHYYKVDRKSNYLTGEIHDNTREISKEEFSKDEGKI